MDRIAYERVKKEICSKDKGHRMTCIGKQGGEKEVYIKLIRSLETRRDFQATLHPGRTPYPLCRRLGGPRARLGGHGKSRVHRISTPGDRPPRSQSLYRYRRRRNVKCARKRKNSHETLLKARETGTALEIGL